MAVAATRVRNAGSKSAHKTEEVYDLVFSGNYATGGEAFGPTTTGVTGFKAFDQVLVHGGVAVASDLATAIPVFYNYATSKFTFYEGSSAGTALTEKTNAEAYPTGCKLRVTIKG